MAKFIVVPNTNPPVYINVENVESFYYNRGTETLYVGFNSAGEIVASFQMNEQDYLNFLYKAL